MSPISRRDFIQLSLAGTASVANVSIAKKKNNPINRYPIRLGGPVFERFEDPLKWLMALKELGYSAAYCPLDANAPSESIVAFREMAFKEGILIAEVGAWSNPIDPDKKKSQKAIEYCSKQLDLAERIGAKCCVNIAGSRNRERWDGPHTDNISQETFNKIVEVTRLIIDSVKPKRTFFTLETMPWIFPNSVESYAELLKAINRKQFAVHLDPVNLINSPDRYFNNSNLIRECFKRLGPYVKSCHAKDTILLNELTTHINETRPGLGNLNYAVFLNELSKLPDIPLMLEHLKKPEDYRAAAGYIRSVAKKNNIPI